MLSTNMSTWQLSRIDVHHSIARAIADAAKVDPGQLTIEVTETALVESSEVVAHRLERLRELGVRVSIDDFGAGFTAIAYLRNFPVNEVKIDRALVDLLDGGQSDRTSLAAAVIALGGAMDLHVVAEGVETPEQARSLRLMGCRVAQGFLFAKPLSIPEVDRLVADNSFRFSEEHIGNRA
jgi:EAL domain-containing protein (putative c-di-GMP-specific phosphodiesterase class I)